MLNLRRMCGDRSGWRRPGAGSSALFTTTLLAVAQVGCGGGTKRMCASVGRDEPKTALRFTPTTCDFEC